MDTLLVVNGARPNDIGALMARVGANEVVATHSPAEAKARVRASRHERVVVVGGDGAVNLVLDALEGRRVRVVVVPAGSANDLARNVGERERTIDVLTVNGRRFCTVGGVGIPARVSARANQVRRLVRGATRLGDALYPVLALEHIAKPRGELHVCVSTEDGVVRDAVDAVFVCNQGTLAGRVTVCKESRNDDGTFEICLVPTARRRTRLMSFARMLTGSEPPRMRVIRAKRATLLLDEAAPFFGDGEELARGARFDIEIKPRELRVSRIEP